MQRYRTVPRLSFGTDSGAGNRELPEEIAVALSYNGSTQAVMMSTPADLVDFAYGFSLSEGIAKPKEIQSVEVVETPHGLDVQIWLAGDAEARLSKRRRRMAGPVGCGLCGIDSLEEATRPVAVVPKCSFTMSPAEVVAAMKSLPRAQPLHDATKAAHAAGFWSGNLRAVREDVGRHNALDKLIGHLAQGPAIVGAVLLTSRVSIDLVQKVAALGAPIMIAVSAPTAQAVALADAAGITLVALARNDRFEAFSHANRISEDTRNVA